MTGIHARRRAVLAGSLASLLIAAALPAHAVNIPEGGAVTPDSSSLFHLRVTSTCDGLPMDELEVTMPDSVRNPVPEAVPGWDVTIEPDPVEADSVDEGEDTDEADEVEPTVVRWSGGPLEDGRLLEFGIRARFPDEEGEVLTFPVIQRCGDVEVESAPTVTLAKRYGNNDIAEVDAEVDQLRADVDVLRADVDRLQEQVGDVNVVNLRKRVTDTEQAMEELDERVTALEGSGEEPTPEPEE
jgi:uncharacterized protein YcnI